MILTHRTKNRILKVLGPRLKLIKNYNHEGLKSLNHDIKILYTFTMSELNISFFTCLLNKTV